MQFPEEYVARMRAQLGPGFPAYMEAMATPQASRKGTRSVGAVRQMVR